MHGDGAEHARKVSGIVSTPLMTDDGQAAPALGAELRGMFSVATENRNIPHAMARSDSDASDAWDDCAELGEMDSTM